MKHIYFAMIVIAGIMLLNACTSSGAGHKNARIVTGTQQQSPTTQVFSTGGARR